MDVTLFEAVTTESQLIKIENEAKKYDGLYVEMNDPEQRKYVKEKAVLISDILKKLDRARIDLSRDYKLKVEAEASDIKERLQKANKPFTLLIDEYSEQRKKILDEQKAKKEAADLIAQIEADHEQAIMMDKIATIEALERAQDEADKIKAIEDRAAKQATLEAEQKIKDVQFKKDKQDEEEARVERVRVENKEHQRAINVGIVRRLTSTGITNEQAEKITTMAIKGEINHLSVNY